MFDIGPGELVLVAIIGLLVLGPQRLPKVAAEIGKWVGRARKNPADTFSAIERCAAAECRAAAERLAADGRSAAGAGYPCRSARAARVDAAFGAGCG